MAQQVDTDILYPALRLAGVLTAAGRTASASQMADAFQALNRMIDAWTLERLMVYTIRVDRWSLDVSKTSYTIGPGGDFDGPRPIRIQDASIVVTTGPEEVHHPLRILTDREWAAKRLREIPTTIPTEMYFDGANPLATIFLWGFPTAGGDLELFTWQQLTQFATETSPVVLPPGYLEAMVWGLACRLFSVFGTPYRAECAREAQLAKARIKAANAPSPRIASADYGMRGHIKRAWNYVTGEAA